MLHPDHGEREPPKGLQLVMRKLIDDYRVVVCAPEFLQHRGMPSASGPHVHPGMHDEAAAREGPIEGGLTASWTGTHILPRTLPYCRHISPAHRFLSPLMEQRRSMQYEWKMNSHNEQS